ncbi:MAG: tRNA preQ1(34) S-adenosylmethionine ribosyltransferase-isomerase QueA [Pyrinomonadaceae bacterium]
MSLKEFDFLLPSEQIASKPLKRRDASRMLFVNRNSNSFEDRRFADIVGLLSEQDVLVLNNTRVFPARLIGESESGGKIEVLLEEEIAENRWQVLAKPAKRLKKGKRLHFADDLDCEVLERNDEGRVILQFDNGLDLWEIFDRVGKTPLPHYIKRNDVDLEDDRERYQTIYAEKRGAIAAPTAGLHFTPELLDDLRNNGVSIVELTLHVGYGTFEPVRVEDLSEHHVLPERLELTQEAADELNKAKADGKRIVAVGTTTTRALESCIDDAGKFVSQTAKTSLTVTPGYKFRAVDALLTNFHLPRSSLLILVSTFGTHDLIMNAYKHAVVSGYRFYSYGDCMFIE